MLKKEKRKLLRELFEKKEGEEYVKWISNKPVYTPSEWVSYLTK